MTDGWSWKANETYQEYTIAAREISTILDCILRSIMLNDGCQKSDYLCNCTSVECWEVAVSWGMGPRGRPHVLMCLRPQIAFIWPCPFCGFFYGREQIQKSWRFTTEKAGEFSCLFDVLEIELINPIDRLDPNFLQAPSVLTPKTTEDL